METSFKLACLAKHLKDSEVRFNLFTFGQELESDVTVISYNYSRNNIVLNLSSGNSYKVHCNEVEEIGCDAILLGYENLELFEERIQNLKEEKPHGIYISTFENNYYKHDKFAWQFTEMKY